jgi:hypothetical protein
MTFLTIGAPLHLVSEDTLEEAEFTAWPPTMIETIARAAQGAY